MSEWGMLPATKGKWNVMLKSVSRFEVVPLAREPVLSASKDK